MTPQSIRNAHRVGFSLIETIATIVVLAALGVVASIVLFQSVDTLAEVSASSQMHTELSIAMDRIDHELHNVLVDANASSLAPDIASVTPASMTWNGDYSLTLSGDQLLMSIDGAAAAVLLDDVSAFSIQTFNESNAALGGSLSGAACDPIRRIQIQISMQRAGVTETLRSRTFLRCTMEGADS